jgi:hypothetical protein
VKAYGGGRDRRSARLRIIEWNGPVRRRTRFPSCRRKLHVLLVPVFRRFGVQERFPMCCPCKWWAMSATSNMMRNRVLCTLSSSRRGWPGRRNRGRGWALRLSYLGSRRNAVHDYGTGSRWLLRATAEQSPTTEHYQHGKREPFPAFTHSLSLPARVFSVKGFTTRSPIH